MPNNIFALLIGIDQYQTMPLTGCVRDSQDVEEYLRHTIQPDRLQLQTLRDDKATKSNIIDGFLSHLGQATADDIVFVHYSGHGSREEADPVFWDFCPDYKNEIIVTVDSLTPDLLRSANDAPPASSCLLDWFLGGVRLLMGPAA